MLEALDLSKRLSKARYSKQLPTLQRRLHRLQRACWEARLATLVVFEGWDAAGKGTAIGKLTQRLEPRGFSLHAIREPRTFESHLPWMWRFWVKVPNWGEMAIYDRSWYGRVLVERVEGLVVESQWREAFSDIVSFERALADDRYSIVKIFLHMSKEQQKQRFQRLEKNPRKSWQVESEDWEHHQRYDEYLHAAEEMLQYTDTEWAPWVLVEAADHRWARAKVFATVIACMEEKLAARGLSVPEDEWSDDEDSDDEDSDDEDSDDEDSDDEDSDDEDSDDEDSDDEDNHQLEEAAASNHAGLPVTAGEG